jgi:hypothetical protein
MMAKEVGLLAIATRILILCEPDQLFGGGLEEDRKR